MGFFYFAVIPPSTTITEPIVDLDSSEARYTAIAAISLGTPTSQLLMKYLFKTIKLEEKGY